jgi:16S rRNA processing protein RimM
MYGDLVTIGRVVRPQGRKGELLTQPLSDRPERFATLRRVFVPAASGAAREVAVTACWPHKGRYVVKLQGVDTISQAEAFRGVDLRIDEQDLAPLPPHTYYHHQLVGLAAEDEAGHALGFVESVLETGARAVVLVIGRGTREVLVPLASDFVREIALETRRIVIRPPEPVEPE